jgi:hypothetical protein
MKQRTASSPGSHSMTREQDEPFAIQQLRDTFLSYPPKEQARIREGVIAQLRDEARSHEFAACDGKGKRPGSALSRIAGPVYGISERDL